MTLSPTATRRSDGSMRWLYGTGGVGYGILETGIDMYVVKASRAFAPFFAERI
jgi:hypothetical protein